jgi:hypothetical protein
VVPGSYTAVFGPVAQWLEQGTHKGMFKRAENGFLFE